MLWLSDAKARAFTLYLLSENTQNEPDPKRSVSMNSIRRIRNCTSHFIINLWCERRQRGTQDWGPGRSASSRTGNVLVKVDKDKMSDFSSILWSLIKPLTLGCLLQTQVFSNNSTRKLGREGQSSLSYTRSWSTAVALECPICRVYNWQIWQRNPAWQVWKRLSLWSSWTSVRWRTEPRPSSSTAFDSFLGSSSRKRLDHKALLHQLTPPRGGTPPAPPAEGAVSISWHRPWLNTLLEAKRF